MICKEEFERIQRLMERLPRFSWSLRVTSVGWFCTIMHDDTVRVYRSPVFETVDQAVAHFNDNGEAIVERQLQNLHPHITDLSNTDEILFDPNETAELPIVAHAATDA